MKVVDMQPPGRDKWGGGGASELSEIGSGKWSRLWCHFVPGKSNYVLLLPMALWSCSVFRSSVSRTTVTSPADERSPRDLRP